MCHYGEQSIVIKKVRNFLEFETPVFLRVKMEVSFLNEGETTPIYIQYFPYTFYGLHILDSDGKFLEFSGNEKDDQSNSENEITVYFPKDKPIYQNDYRTITFDYIYYNPQLEDLPKMRTMEIFFTLFKGARTYIFIKQCKEYDFEADVFGYDNQTGSIIGYSLIDGPKRLSNFFEFSVESSDESLDNPISILVLFSHRIPKSLIYWYYMGAYFGVSVVFLLPIAYHFDSSFRELWIVTASSCISVLVIIKGWIFQKNMDRHLKRFDSIYISAVTFLFIEILCLIDDSILFSALKIHLSQLVSPYYLLFIERLIFDTIFIIFFFIDMFHKLFI